MSAETSLRTGHSLLKWKLSPRKLALFRKPKSSANRCRSLGNRAAQAVSFMNAYYYTNVKNVPFLMMIVYAKDIEEADWFFQKQTGVNPNKNSFITCRIEFNSTPIVWKK
jgi:hypothetical protein